MKLYKVLLALFLFFSISSFSQKYELGKVTLDELKQKQHPIDSSAVAAILYKRGQTYFRYEDKKGFRIVHEIEYRIKIYKKEGLNWANFEVPYYIGYENILADYVEFSNCNTYNLENDKIIKTKLSSEGKFNITLNKNWRKASLTMPNVKAGSIIEIHYTILSENAVEFPTFNFQYTIPLNYAEYKTDIPEFYVYNTINSGFLPINSDYKIGIGTQSYEDQYRQNLTMTYKQVESVHKVINIPAIIEEPYVDNIQNYNTAINYELEKTRFPETTEKIFTTTWEDVAKSIYKYKDFGEELLIKDYFENDLKVITNSQMTDMQKIESIFKFVQSRMNWNKSYGYFTDKGVKKAYQEKTGNVADINFILISMLNYAGLNANPVILSTIDNGIPVYPNRTVFNYVIASIEIDSKIILLDASNKKTNLSTIPLKTINWNGRLIRQDGSSTEISLIPKNSSIETTNLIYSIDSDFKISGKSRIQKNEYIALEYRENQSVQSIDLDNKYAFTSIENYNLENFTTDIEKPIIETFNFKTEEYLDKIGDKIIISPLLFLSNEKNPFTQENRMFPIHFGYPKTTKINIFLELPEGYSVESFPKSIIYTSPQKDFIMNYFSIINGNKIQLSVTKEIKSSLLHQDSYESIKDFYKQIIDKQNEKIVLKKL
jgi:hypothetical protein